MTVLELADVDAYYGNSHVLFDLSMAIEENEVITLLGRNGAGKTTTLRAITGTVPRREGHISFRGEDIAGLSVEAISKRGIKLVPEGRRVFPTLTVMENVRIAHDLATDPRAVEEAFELFPVLDDLREVLGDVVERDVTVVMTEQNVEFALDLGERAYIVDKGANVWDGPVDALRDRDDLLDEYLSVSADEA